MAKKPPKKPAQRNYATDNTNYQSNTLSVAQKRRSFHTESHGKNFIAHEQLAQQAAYMAQGTDYRMRGLNSPTDHNIYQSTGTFTVYSGSQRPNERDRLRYVYDNAAATQVLSQVPLTQFISSDASPTRQRGLVGANIAQMDHRSNLLRMSHNDAASQQIPSIAS